MNGLIESIYEQVTSCKKLLRLFQDERKLYQASKNIGPKEVKEILERKKLIVSAFEEQHHLIKVLRAENPALNSEEERLQKENLRILGALLEQLLVIDYENEKLLRAILSPGSSSQPGSNGNSALRPSMQKQMPFIPGGQTHPAGSRTAAAAPQQKTPRTRGSSVLTASSRLSKYAPKQEQYESKYA